MTEIKKPILDEIFTAIVNGDQEKLQKLSEERPAESIGVRVAISTDQESGSKLNFDLEEIQEEAPWMISLLEGPRFFFISAYTALQTRLTGGQSFVPIDWSFSFDSNVAEKIRGFFNFENIDVANRDRIIILLRLIKRHKIQTDFVPFIYENLRLQRENPKNERPLKTIAAFKAIDYLDWDAFEKNPYRPCFVRGKTPSDFLGVAEEVYSDFLKNEEFQKRETKALFSYAFLLELVREWLANDDSIGTKFSRLIDYCIFELGRVPNFELGLAWEFLKKPKGMRFFGPVADFGKDVMKDLQGMGWDISHVRMLETMATTSRMGSFYLPFFVSLDDKFIELIRLNPIRFIAMDDNARSVISARAGEIEIQTVVNQHMSAAANAAMNPIEVARRRSLSLDGIKILELASANATVVAELIEQRRVERNKRQKLN